MRARLLMLVAVCCFAMVDSLAAQPAFVRIRGKVQAFENPIITVASRDGSTLRVALGDQAAIMALKRLQLSDIKQGDFIGTAARPGEGGRLEALEVVVFPESARGTGEGHYDWDLVPGSSMTNATVTAAVQDVQGRNLSLSYKGGTAQVMVPPSVPVVTPIPAAREDLVQGAALFVIASKTEDGSFVARRIIVEKDGVTPPM
jgi:hypothetical protein